MLSRLGRQPGLARLEPVAVDDLCPSKRLDLHGTPRDIVGGLASSPVGTGSHRFDYLLQDGDIEFVVVWKSVDQIDVYGHPSLKLVEGQIGESWPDFPQARIGRLEECRNRTVQFKQEVEVEGVEVDRHALKFSNLWRGVECPASAPAVDASTLTMDEPRAL